MNIIEERLNKFFEEEKARCKLSDKRPFDVYLKYKRTSKKKGSK